MPIFPSVIPEVTNHLIDPIIKQSILRLINQMGYADVFKDNIDIRADWMKDSSTTDSQHNTRINPDRFIAEVMVQMNPSSTKWNTMGFRHTLAYGINNNEIYNQYPVFVDEDSGVTLLERGSPCSIVLTCRMVFQDKGHGFQTAAMLFQRWMTDSIMEHNDFFFDYPIPGDLLKALEILYGLKQVKEPTFFDYLRIGSNRQIGQVVPKELEKPIERVDSRGNLVTETRQGRSELVIRRTRIGCLHTLEYGDESPQANLQGKRPSQFEIPFVYTIQFEMPNHLLLTYPIIIDQQLVPSCLIPIDKEKPDPDIDGEMANVAQNAYYQMYRNQRARCYTVPFYDDWFPPVEGVPYQNTQCAFYQAALLVNPADDLTTVDLKGDMGAGARLNPIVLEILRIQGKESFAIDSIFNIAAYRNNTWIDSSSMSFVGPVEDLVVGFPAKRLGTIYHLAISQPADFWKINKKWWWLIARYKDFLGYTKIVDTLKIPTDNTDRGEYGTYTPFRILYTDILACRPGEGADR